MKETYTVTTSTVVEAETPEDAARLGYWAFKEHPSNVTVTRVGEGALFYSVSLFGVPVRKRMK